MSRAFRSLMTAIVLAATGALAAAAADVSEEILAKAIDSYHAGNLGAAIGGINAALRGGLPASQKARALYYRGLAHRRQGSPGHAISDLSRALDFDGLSDAERSDAMEARSAAYQEAGIADQETVVVTAASGVREPSAKPAPPAPAEIKRPPAAANTPVTASIEAPQAAAPKWTGTTQVAVDAPLPPPAPRQPAQPQAAKPAPVSKANGARVAVDAPAKAASQVAASSSWATEQVRIAPLPAVAAPKTTIRSAPRKRTESSDAVAARPAPAEPLPAFVTQVAAVVPATPALAAAPAATPPMAPPEIRLLVGEAHSRSEAFALAIRLTSQRGAALGPRRPQIAAGTMADVVVYRVRLGPFADLGEAQALCRSLRDSGYDCALE